MKKITKICVSFLFVFLGLFLLSCKENKQEYTLEILSGISTQLNIGENDVDFTKYFKIKDEKGNEIEVKNEYLDLTNVNLDEEGTFLVTLKYEGKEIALYFEVKNKENSDNKNKYFLEVVSTLPTNLKLGEKDIDFTKYFKIKDENGSEIEVKNEYLDLTNVNLDEEGTFLVTLKYEGKEISLTFEVKNDSTDQDDTLKLEDLTNAINALNKAKSYEITIIDPNVDESDTENYYTENIYITENSVEYRMSMAEYIYNALIFEYNGKWAVYITELYEGIMEYSVEYYQSFDEAFCDQVITFYYFDEYQENDFVLDGDHFKLVDLENESGKYDYIYGGMIDITQFDIYISDGKVNKLDTKYTTDFMGEVSEDEELIIYSDFDKVNLTSKIEIAKKWIDENKDEPNPGDLETSTTSFQDAQLNVLDGEIGYTASLGAQAFIENRGVQYLQANGDVVLTSKSPLTVKNLSIVCQTNADNGFEIEVKVGDKVMRTADGKDVFFVAKTRFDELVYAQFASSEELTGIITITLKAKQTSKSMYISKIYYNSSSVGPKEVMEKQEYDVDTFISSKITDVLFDYEGGFGMSPTGDYHVLVVPVEFTDIKYTQDELDDLEKVFNGTSLDTGYESVRTFYEKSSYGKLNLTFDIKKPFLLQHDYNYYRTELDRDIDILIEVLLGYDSEIDFSLYDYDKDGILDGIYLIYCGDVDYEEDTNYWAWVNWYVTDVDSGEIDIVVDETEVWYYLFAGAQFMYESADTEKGFDYYGVVEGLYLNPMTYIHETGHMLGLDDYYDTKPEIGSKNGTGSACIMDGAYGDHDAFSKTILGWITPTIVNETVQVTINPFSETGDSILIPLNFNNSYFCEYLLIALYNNDGLCELFDQKYYNLFGGAEYGVYIEYVNAELNNREYDDAYYAVTHYNNSTTNPAMLWFVEADGENYYKSTQGCASSSDLWQTGETLSGAFSEFTRLDGKLVNFDIKFDEVTKEKAVITITFNE